jgi:hypothetical protein
LPWLILVILVIVLVAWLIGLLADVAGSAIHFLLIVASVILIYNLVTRGRAARTTVGRGGVGSRRRAGASSGSDSAQTRIRPDIRVAPVVELSWGGHQLAALVAD